METDLFSLKLKIARLELHNARLIDTLEEAANFIDNYSDVVDGESGPEPNEAMSLKMECEAALANMTVFDYAMKGET